ncbi:unnamed protein product [Brugia timori]|uniref:Uncharacterized protein n=1 Tax=Brugia timori TaxID=42155 RepID=A0A0R3R765_9BILA|nr:unnamed protein product [Brugia timori]
MVYLSFIVYCGNQQQNRQGMRVAPVGMHRPLTADVITDYKLDKLWDDELLMEITQVEECMLIS